MMKGEGGRRVWVVVGMWVVREKSEGRGRGEVGSCFSEMGGQ